MEINDVVNIIETACEEHFDEVSETWVNMLGLWVNYPYLDVKFKAQLSTQMFKIATDINNGVYD